jgi:hypothetical protein
MDIPIDTDLDLLAIEEAALEDLPETAAGGWISTASSFSCVSSMASVACLSSL